MPLPARDRMAEYATKGVHLALRQAARAPEQVAARRLADQAPTTPGDGARVAVLSPRDWAVHVQWEAMIAQALRLRGAEVTFVTCGGGLEVCDRANTWEGPPMPCASCTRYVEDAVDSHGFHRLALRTGWDGTPAEWAEIDGLSVDDLPAAEWEGVPLGALTEIPVKWFLMRTDLENEPLAGSTWRAFLRSARRIAMGVEQALDRLRPDVVLLLNGTFLFEAVAWEICRRRGIDVVTYERGMIKETLVFRRGSPACLFDYEDEWSLRRGRPLTSDEEDELDDYLDDRRLGRRTIDRFWTDPVFDAPETGGDGRLVTLFTNLTWDSAVIGRDRAFPSMQDWLAAAVDVFGARPQDRLIVRIHPAEAKLPGKRTREPMRGVIDRRIGSLPDNVTVLGPEDPTSSYALMAASDVGLVYTSTAGLELALTGTPVLVSGETHYREKGFTIDLDRAEDFVPLLDRVLADPAQHGPDVETARRYAHLFFFEAPIRSPGVEEHVPGLARLTISDLADLAPGADPDLDRICAAILGGHDLPAADAA